MQKAENTTVSVSNSRGLILWFNRLISLFSSMGYSVLLVLFFSQVTFAQQTVKGQVKDKTQTPISGATIKLESTSTNSALETTSDEKGSFLFLQVPPGEYRIIASAINYQNKGFRTTISPRANLLVNVDLELNSGIAEVVEVKDQLLLDETKDSSLAIANTDIVNALPQARRTNLPDLVSAFVPGAVASHDNFIHFRGNELSLNTAVNGVTFIDNPHQYFAAGLPPDVIKSFSVITGGFPAEYGSRFGGIVDAVTRSGFDNNNHGSLSFSGGNFLRNTASAEVGGHSKNFGYYFYAAANQSLRFLNPPETRELHSFGKALRTFAQFDYKPTSTDTFRLMLINSGANFQIPNTTQDEINGRDLFQRSREQTAILTYEKKISGTSLLTTSLYERLTSSRLLPTSDPISVQASGLRNNLTLGLRSDYTNFVNSRHTIKTGLELTLYRLREDFQFDPRFTDEPESFAGKITKRNLSQDDSDGSGEEEEIPLLPAFNFRGRETGGNLGFYFQDKIKLSNNFVANLGLRYDQYSLLTSENLLSPRINLAYTVKPQSTTIFFSYNRLFAPPPIENLLLSGNLAQLAPPRPVKSNLFELGVNQLIKNRLIVQLSTFFRNDKRSYELTELANVRYFLPSTFERGRSYGLELSVQLPEIPRLGISGYFNYTAQRAFQFGEITGGFSDEALEEGSDSADEKQIKNPQLKPSQKPSINSSASSPMAENRMSAIFDQIHTGTAGIMWRERKSGFTANLTFEYGSGTPFPGQGRLPEHFAVNLYTALDIFKRDTNKVSLQFNVENLTNRIFAVSKESEFTPLQFSPPRYFSGAIKVQF